jgi:hypothetical protein
MKYFLKHFVFKYFKNYTFNQTVEIKHLLKDILIKKYFLKKNKIIIFMSFKSEKYQ